MKVEFSQRKQTITKKRSRTPSPEPSLRPSKVFNKEKKHPKESKLFKKHKNTEKIESSPNKIAIQEEITIERPLDPIINTINADSVIPDNIIYDLSEKHLLISERLSVPGEKNSKTPPNSPNYDFLIKETLNEPIENKVNKISPLKKTEEKDSKQEKQSKQEKELKIINELESKTSSSNFSPVKQIELSDTKSKKDTKISNSKISIEDIIDEIPEKTADCKEEFKIIDDNSIAYEDIIFTFLKKLKKTENSKVKCSICNRVIKVKSIPSHFKSQIHNNQLTT